MQWALAKLVMGWHGFFHFLKFPFRRRKGGVRAFLENYREERLFPLSRVDKNWLQKFSRCVNCGLCDTACPALWQVSKERFPGPSYMVIALSRSTPEAGLSGVDFSLCSHCRSCQQACPNLVPIKEAFEFIEAKSQNLLH